MNQLSSLIHDVKSHCEDNLYRFKLADYLEANGQPERAEFIRVQVEGGALHEDDPKRDSYVDRNYNLTNMYAAGWAKNFDKHIKHHWEFIGGFLKLMLTSRKTLALLEQKVPPEEWVWVDSVWFDFRGDKKASLREQVATLEKLAGKTILNSLNLYGSDFDSAAIESVAALPSLEYLHSITLDMNPIAAAGANALALSPSLPRLKRLSLIGCEIGDKGLAAIVDSKTLPPPTSLDLPGNSISPQGAQYFAENIRGEKLTFLDLGSNKIGDEGVIALARSRRFPKLKTLALYGNDIGKRGATALVKSDAFPELKYIRLYHNHFGAKGVAQLRARFGNVITGLLEAE